MKMKNKKGKGKKKGKGGKKMSKGRGKSTSSSSATTIIVRPNRPKREGDKPKLPVVKPTSIFSATPSAAPTILSAPTVIPTTLIISGSEQLTIQPTDTVSQEPTMIPTATAPPTLSPTIPISGFRVSAAPFIVDYEITGTPTTVDFDEAAEVTLLFLEDFFVQQFDFNVRTNMRAFAGSLTGTDLSLVEAMYTVVIVFEESSAFIPKQADIDAFLFSAFQRPFVDELLTSLGNLPSNNPFSTTSKAEYEASNKRRQH